MLKSGLYFVGRTLAALVLFVGAGLPALAYGGEPGAQGRFLPLFGMLALAVMAGVVAHELGHLLACRAVGAEVREFQIGGKEAPIRFSAGTVKVSLGWPYRGRVHYAGAPLVWRRAVITLAGSLTDLALAGLVLASSAAMASGHGVPPLAVTAADGLAVIGLVSLLPYRTRSGELTDGAFHVVLLPGRLPDDAALLAERRVSALAQRRDLGGVAPVVFLTLALLRLRQGDAQGHAEAERLCGRVLSGKDVSDPIRGMALAAVIMSRQGRGLPHADVRAALAEMRAEASRNAAAMVAELSAVLDPEKALRAFRDGDPSARLGVGSIATMLRRQGRTSDLLELHGGFGEVEPLCAPALAVDVGPENRATVLATIALARRALGQPYAHVLAEAVALSPEADMVAEAERIQPARESQPQP